MRAREIDSEMITTNIATEILNETYCALLAFNLKNWRREIESS
jgi:hypothetical protein